MRIKIGERTYWKLVRVKQTPDPDNPRAGKLSDLQPLISSLTGQPEYYRTREAAVADRDHLNHTAPKGTDPLKVTKITIIEELDEPLLPDRE